MYRVCIYIGTHICWRQIIWQAGSQEKEGDENNRNQEKMPFQTARWAERVVSTDWQLQFTCQHQKRFRFVPFRSAELHWNTMLNLTIHCISHSFALPPRGTFPPSPFAGPNPIPNLAAMTKLQHSLCVCTRCSCCIFNAATLAKHC